MALTLVALLATMLDAARLESPSGNLWVEVESRNPAPDPNYPDGQRLYFRMGSGQSAHFDWSPLGIEFNEGGARPIDLLNDLIVTGLETETGLHEQFTLPHGKQRHVASPYNELRLNLQNADGDEMRLVFRAFDDGIGFHYEFPGTGTWTLVREHSGFLLPAGTTGYLQMKDFPALYAPNYQDPIVKAPAGTLSPGNGYVLPGLFELPDAQTWMLFHESGLTNNYYGAHLDEPTPNRLYNLALPNAAEGNGIGEVVPTAELPFHTPWRIFAIGDLATVAETNLVNLLAEPFDTARFGSYDWVQPGKSAWSWWSQDTGTPSLQYEYIDFAYEYGWEYILIDARWDQWANAGQEIQDLVAYADARNVKINLWYNSGGPHNSVTNATPRNRMLDPAIRQAEMDTISGWGVSGIKVDFFFSDKQDRIQQYIGIMEDALERGLVVNFHGATVPRGWSRTYPNLLSTEAVAGAENYKWRAEPEAMQNVRYTFTRNVVGPMDYTPLTFETALWRVGVSYAHQLALAVVFESGLQHFADRADSLTTSGFRKLFADVPEAAGFLTDLPTAWDETRLLDGHPDTHAVWARRRGHTWYVGGINGLDSSLGTTVYLADVVDRPVRVEAFSRGSADNDLAYSDTIHQATEALPFNMAARDGFTLRISLVPINFTDWIALFTDILEERSPNADNDLDGLNNLMEFVFDRNPFIPDSELPNLPAIIIVDGQAMLRFKLRPGILLSDLHIQKSSSLDFSSAERVEIADTLTGETNWHWLQVETGSPIFFRILVSE